ncbi:MAG: hypothetical protein TREMPRED_003173 [Tremellales sp. Tagirdzhanova-0007]|nr:MAG: hypothetical protein TREMPRED_003173 [Tremellales sp. Tagirdzhanova-0007]
MDSPLFPTIRRPTTSSPSGLMADLFLASSHHSPDDDLAFPSPSHPYSSDSHASSSHSHSRPSGRPANAPVMDDQTPRKPRKTHAGKPRFSLFAAPQSQPNGPAHIADDEEEEEEEEGVGMEDAVGRQEDDGGGGGEDGDGGDDGEEGEDHTIHAPRRSISNWNRPAQSDDKLRESLYELREMNEVFDGFLTALEAARGHNERLATRVQQTSALLDQYTALLGQTEHTQQLILNPNWTGAYDDAVALAAEQESRQAAEAAAVVEAERAAEAARRAEEEKERLALEASKAREAASRGGARGRGSGVTRGGTTRGRGSGIPTTNTRQPVVAGSRTPGLAPKKTLSGGVGAGLGGKYADVKSSGYGPR